MECGGCDTAFRAPARFGSSTARPPSKAPSPLRSAGALQRAWARAGSGHGLAVLGTRAVPRLVLGLLFAQVPSSLGAEDDLSPPRPASETVDFERDIRPIFERACIDCHGPEKQKSGYRLDSRNAALNGGDVSAPNIRPGDSAGSPLIRFVAGLDTDLRMPARGEALSTEEVNRLRAWIDQGAVWPESASPPTPDPLDWWSLKPLARPACPPVSEAGWVRNPIDAFVLARLEEHGLSPAPEADRRTLIRRLSFDLLGLPPAPAEVEDFVNDPAPDAYARLVDRLLASPRHGERWARHWLDVVHYGDTHGYDKDQPRPNAWPYRDYVIRALDEDKPYGRFVREQLAGDVLYPGTEDGIVALGFIAAGPWDLIGHAEVPETKVDGQIARMLDRDDMVANTLTTFCSTTVHCARCHNHKFDPIQQVDYYRLQAVFAALDRADKSYDPDPALAQQRAALDRRLHRIKARKQDLDAVLTAAGGPELNALDQAIAAARDRAKTGQRAEFGWHSAIESAPDTVKWVQVDLGEPVAIAAVEYVGCHDDFNGIGDGFGFPPRFKIELSDDPEFHDDVRLLADRTEADAPNPGVKPQRIEAAGGRGRFVRITATRLAPRQNDFIFALAEVRVFDQEGRNVALKATVTASDSIEAPPRWSRINLVDGYAYGAGESDASKETGAELERRRSEWVAANVPAELLASLETVRREQQETEAAIAALPPPRKVYAGTVHSGSGSFRGTGAEGGRPRPIHVLARGDVRQPRDEVRPGTLPFIPGTPDEFGLPNPHPEGARRAALARWVTDPRNPLTWRSIVNRVWQHHFGRGLVDSPNDFGRMGQAPSHPELLDWLASEFVARGGSLKDLHRLIVTSATYRQASVVSLDALEQGRRIDVDNRLLWRMNRRKLEAEAVRDAMLAVAGKLDLTMGGPGFQDFVVEKPEHSPHYQYHLADPNDPSLHRRSIYRFLVRSQPQPFMAALDCADPSMSVDRRNQTLTALQALALRNDRLVIALAAAFAERLTAESTDAGSRIERAFRLALGRPATPDEREALTGYARQHGLPNACRVLFNLNEFTFVD
ncbi:MAG: DUF1553 domain-containing protein [Verrucomicrobiales bacterium]|nr:DUF1553 domain-containing protein [Verrucomicrobiales bacterium]